MESEFIIGDTTLWNPDANRIKNHNGFLRGRLPIKCVCDNDDILITPRERCKYRRYCISHDNSIANRNGTSRERGREKLFHPRSLATFILSSRIIDKIGW